MLTTSRPSCTHFSKTAIGATLNSNDASANCCGRRLDLKEYPNIGALMACGEHNRILDDLRTPPQPSRPDPADGNKPGTKKIKLGPVTKRGEFASLIKDKDGRLLGCNAHKKSEPCKAGVAAGQGHDAHVGKCAYHHS